eukprot:Mrub_01936.p1 GENE.Mrub_01936~~Mrub_01936.p1  ORF type:complete len:605 (+),score=54.78 Mrub_01936:159-1817(+)
MKQLSYKNKQFEYYRLLFDLYFVIVGSIIIFGFFKPIEYNLTEPLQPYITTVLGSSNCNSNININQQFYSKYTETYMYFIDILFTYYRPFLFVHILRQVRVVTILSSGMNNDSLAHIQGVIHFTIGVLIYMYIDIYVQYFDESISKSNVKDVKYINSIKNLKNHKYAISHIIHENPDLPVSKLFKYLDNELNDLENGIDMLTTEIKANKGLINSEENIDVESIEFMRTIKNTHSSLAKNGKNVLEIETVNNFPEYINIKKLNIKRLIDNLVINQLKRMDNKNMKITFELVSNMYEDPINNQNLDFVNSIKILSDKIKSDYIKISITDNGMGIPLKLINSINKTKSLKSKMKRLPSIFDIGADEDTEDKIQEMKNDFQILKLILNNLKGSLYYYANPNICNVYTLFLPLCVTSSKIIKYSSMTSHSINSEETDHICDAVYLAEDNPNILSKYEKFFDKKKIPYYSFLNGKLCLDKLKKHNCQKCKKICVFTDLRMPNMDGFELCQELRKIKFYCEIKIVLITAEEATYVDESIFDKVYNKPMPLPKLISEYNN